MEWLLVYPTVRNIPFTALQLNNEKVRCVAASELDSLRIRLSLLLLVGRFPLSPVPSFPLRFSGTTQCVPSWVPPCTTLCVLLWAPAGFYTVRFLSHLKLRYLAQFVPRPFPRVLLVHFFDSSRAFTLQAFRHPFPREFHFAQNCRFSHGFPLVSILLSSAVISLMPLLARYTVRFLCVPLCISSCASRVLPFPVGSVACSRYIRCGLPLTFARALHRAFLYVPPCAPLCAALYAPHGSFLILINADSDFVAKWYCFGPKNVQKTTVNKIKCCMAQIAIFILLFIFIKNYKIWFTK